MIGDISAFVLAHAATVAGYVVAMAAAAISTALDCYFTMSKSLPRVPGFIIIHPAIVSLAVLCGVAAVIAFALTDPAGTDVISTAITLKQTNPILRGFIVGAMVLVLLRSKLFNVKDSGFGGEAIYTLLRTVAIESVNDTRTQRRANFLNANISAAFVIPNYFLQLDAVIVPAARCSHCCGHDGSVSRTPAKCGGRGQGGEGERSEHADGSKRSGLGCVLLLDDRNMLRLLWGRCA